MVRAIKICIYTISTILLIVCGITLYSFFSRYEALDFTEKIRLIEEDSLIRGGETSQSAIINAANTSGGEDNKALNSNPVFLSDSTLLDTLQFLFASLALENVDQFIFSFNVETILLEFQSLNEDASKKILNAMNQISRDNTIENIKYNELDNNQVILKVEYEDEKEAEIIIQLDKATSINFASEPTFYNIITPVSEILEQVETTIQ